jgi:hypothetical protein
VFCFVKAPPCKGQALTIGPSIGIVGEITLVAWGLWQVIADVFRVLYEHVKKCYKNSSTFQRNYFNF